MANTISPRPTPTSLDPKGPESLAISSASTARILPGPDLDDAVDHAGLVRCDGFGRRAAQHLAGRELERAAVQRALHRPERDAEPHRPLVQRRALMRTAVPD